MLILFDIDGTLLLTNRAGLTAMKAATSELYGDEITFEGVDFAGRLDPLIWAAVVEPHDIDAEAEHDRFRAEYARQLRKAFDETATSNLLPGVRELVEALDAREDITLGLLTVNYPETGEMKITAAGMDPGLFPIAAWGCDGPQRRDLTPVAMQRYEEKYGQPIASDRVLVIGDTIHDVECATVHGCRSLAVATGPMYSIHQLQDTGADLVVEDLSDTKRILTWIMNESAPVFE